MMLVISSLSLPAFSHSNTERIIVRFKQGITPFASDEIHRNLGIKSAKKLSNINSIEVLELPSDISAQNAVKLYKMNPNILYAEPDYHIRVDPVEGATLTRSEVQYAKQWALQNDGQKVGKYVGIQDADINAPESWELTKGDKDVVVGVIDTGIFYTHPNLKDNIWVNPGEIAGNGIDDDNNGFKDDIHGINTVERSGDPLDDNGHGTHCAGVIGASGKADDGTFGVNQKISIAGCKFLDGDGGGRMSDALICLDYFAKLKARKKDPVNLVAVNASWGGGRYSEAMLDAIKKLRDLGVLFIAASGNDRENNDEVDSYPADYKLDNIISVAATNNKDELAYFSNYGKHTVHVGAPGMDILSTYLDDQYKIFSGTSMATPYVTGLVGLLKSKDPSLDWKQLRNLVLTGGTPLDSLKDKTITGRRIRSADSHGIGSLTCVNQRARARILPASDKVSVKVGENVDFFVIDIKCAGVESKPSMAVNMGRTVEFVDRQGTGNYSAVWTADAPGSYTFDLGAGDKVDVEVRD
ncbi:MAG: S8 family peptidase [Myxococcota bacterium]